jgi:hypothetical protein
MENGVQIFTILKWLKHLVIVKIQGVGACIA